jgi:hypothetical protein
VVVLADNDVVFKLAACDVLDRLPDVFGIKTSDIFVLPSAHYAYRSSRKRKMLGAAGLGQLNQFLPNVQTLDEASLLDDPDVRRLQTAGGEAMDPGEAVMFVATKLYPSARLATGDKRCLRALAGANGCDDIRSRVEGCVVCFEQVMRRLLEAMPYEDFCACVVPAKQCDGALRNAFPRDHDTPQEQVAEAFASYTGSLRRQTGAMLVTWFPAA